MTSIPRLSIIVPARNAEAHLARSLPALTSTLADDCELILVDDFSSDSTSAVAAGAGAIVIRLQVPTGPSGARNAGAAIAQSNVLVFIDADVEVRSDTVGLLFETLATNPDYAAVFGSYDNNPADRHLVSRFKNLMHHYVHQTGNPEAETFWTGCGAIRRDVFESVGPFNPVDITCIEDVDYGHRLRDAGHRVLLRRDIQCKHLKRWTLAGWIKTDVFQRAIPWTVMMLRRGKMDSDLNLGITHRLSALSALAAVAGIFLSVFLGLKLLLITFIAIIALCWLQSGFYGFLARQGGWSFMIACLPLHVLYFFYCLFALVVGTVVHLCYAGEPKVGASKK